jgi:LacI family transcriptional regulator
MAAEIVRRKLKVVCLGGEGFKDSRYVGTGSEALCRTAIEHLADRGFNRLAYFGDPASWSVKRAESITQIAQERKLDISFFPQPHSSRTRGHETLMRALVDWLNQLEQPVGILAADDLLGRRVIDACAVAGIHIPEQIAVIGIDNDELICDLAHPSLTSVALNAERIGFESARILDELIRGVKPPKWLEIDPMGVVARQSTELLAIEDADIAAALRFIRSHACDGVTVSEVVEQISVSRKTLEERFKRILGRTPQVEIRRIQLQRAKDLLVRSDLKLASIASKAGFSSVQYLHASFKKEVGLTPFEYRTRNRRTGL